MTGELLARALGIEPRGLHWLDDGRASVVAGYTVGASSILVQSSIQYRPPGIDIWLTRVDPRAFGDGPSYMIPSSVAHRFVPGVEPPVPGLEMLRLERLDARADSTRLRQELDESDTNYWITATVEDATSNVAEIPKNLGRGAGWVAGSAVKAATDLLGGAAGSFYGALPFWLQVGIPVLLVGGVVAGVVVAVRGVRGVGALRPGA